MFTIVGKVPTSAKGQAVAGLTQCRNASTVKKRRTQARIDMFNFLGPKNFKGWYTKNPLAFPPKSNSTNFMTQFNVPIRRTAPDWKRVFARRSTNRPLHPFPENQFCKSNLIVSPELKHDIVGDVDSGLSPQQVAVKHGISIPRVEALVKLRSIEANFTKSNQLSRYETAMNQMFPLLKPGSRVRDDLTEIPIPQETRHQRFLSVAESEPFGPVDAAKVLDVEPAAETLAKLSNHEQQQKGEKVQEMSFLAARVEGERTAFRFTNAKVGQVGHRYGASRDDRRHARKVKFTRTGRMVYA